MRRTVQRSRGQATSGPRRPLPVDLLPDETLLAGFGAGDEELSLALVRRFQRRVYGVAMAVVGEAGLAEDVAQQAFERAWRHAPVYDPRRGSVGTWLSTITRNLAIDALRVRRPEPVDPSDLLTLVATMSDGPDLAAERGESIGRLRQALATLPIEQAKAVTMAGIYGLTAQEVAVQESIPLGTAKTRIRRATAKLRQALEPAREEAEDRGE